MDRGHDGALAAFKRESKVTQKSRKARRGQAMMSDAGLTFAALVLPSGARSYELAGLRCIAASRRDERIVKQGKVAYPETGASGVLWKMWEGSRVINLILVVIFLVTGTAYAEQAGCSATPGKEISRWAIKTSVVNPASKPIAIKLGYLMELDNPPVDKAMRKQLLTGRLARQPRGKVKEGDIVMIEGYLQRAHCSADDDDYHVEISTSPTSNDCFIVEIPNGRYMKAPYNKQADAGRKIIRDMFGGRKPHGALDTPIKVRVMGSLFYDSQHYSKKNPQGGGRRGTNQCATNLWEIHPVLYIVPVN